MGEKRVCFFLLVSCAVVVSGHSRWGEFWKYSSKAAASGPLSCAHDGYEKDDKCICTPHFTRSSCTQRVCMNQGTLRSPSMDQGCKCPPGFLGTSCEPVQCVPGTSHSFYEETEKQSLYVLVTYNSFMNATIFKNKDDPIVAVCQAVKNLTIPSLYWSIDAPFVNNILTGQNTVQECVDDAKSMCDPPSSCDPNTLTIENINSIIDQSQPNSQVLIITNSALNQTLNADETIKKAIARRIKVHVIAFAPEKPITDRGFNDLPGYAVLRSITDSTFGFFITPYSGISNTLMSTTTASEAISQIINFISNNYAPVAVRPAKTVQQFHYTVDRRSKFYIAFRSLGIEPEDITFTTQPNGLTLEQDTGFWKLYSAQEKSGKTNFTLQYTGSASDFNVQVLSPSVLNTFVAVSSSDTVDASSPYGTIGAKRTVVARVLNGNTPVTENLSVNMSTGIQFAPDVNERSDCQFSVSLGTVECKESSYGVLSVVSQDGKGSAVPFLCSNEVRISKDNRMNRLSGQQQLATLDESPGCSSELKDSPLVEVLPLKRTFAIIARNVKDTSNTDGSTVDNVFIYPNNILDYLVSYLTENPDYYTTFLANIFPFENPNAAYQTPDLTSFMTYVMNTVHEATENNRKARFNYSVALQNSLFVHESYADILVVVDSVTDGLFDDLTLLQTTSPRRLKIYFVLVETYTTFVDIVYQRFNGIAMKTGGAAFRMSDYTAVRKFFDKYFNGIVGRDMVSFKPFYIADPSHDYIQTDLFSVTGNSYYSAFLISSNGGSSVVKAALYSPTSDKEVDLCPPEAVGKDLAVVSFKCSEFTSGTYALRIYPDQAGTTSFLGNVVVFEKTLDLTTSVAFSANTNEDADSGILYFNQPQYVAVKLVGSTDTTKHTVTLKDENGTILVDHAPAISRENCLFPIVLDYEWRCRKANGVYQVQVDSTVGSTNITRTQILTCLDRGGQACVHGKLDTDQNCICDMGWAGADCLTRVCQNGGTTLPDNTCACVPGQYTGEFCQTSLLSCSSSPDLPYFANEVASLILVVERSTTPLTLDITSAIMRSISGTQIVVVYYGGGLDPAVMLSTTDSQLLAIFLKQQSGENVDPSAPSESPYAALLLGMKAQLTARALLVLVSRGGDFPIDDLFVKQLSQQRVDLRVFTEQYPSNFSTLAMLGNGISFLASRDDFQKVYFPNYIVPIASKATILSSPILNVIASDTSCNATISIPAEDFSASLKLFVHVTNSDGTVTVRQGESQVDSTKIGSGTYSFTISSQVETTISISGSDQCSYLVEILNYYKVGYVFQRNNLDENGFLGPVSGPNYVSLSAANTPPTTDVSMMPRIQLRPIAKTGTLGDVIPVVTTVKSPACAYGYIAELSCTTDIFGYQAQIQTFPKTSSMRHQQITMVCLQLDSNSCKNGGQFTDGTCKCKGWEGADCGLPICMNGGMRENGVCICSPNTFGKFCEEVQPLHIAFILDSVGKDDTAFNSSITAILEFAGLYNMEELQIMLTDNAYKFTLNRNFVSYTNNSLYSTLTQLFPYRDDTGDMKLDDVFSTIKSNAVDLNLTSSNNYVFYVTQSGGKLQNSAILDDLRQNHGFTISCIGVSAYDRSLPSSTLNELAAIGVTKTADNWYTAMMEMANITQNVDNPPPSPPPRPQCVNEQLSVFFAVDLSKGVDPYREKILAILNMFPSAFNLGYDILSGNDGCNVNMDISTAYNGSTRISGWTYFDQWLGVPSPSFCVSNLASVMTSTQRDEGDSPSPSLNTTDKGLMRTFTRILNNTCLCSRYNDDSTKKIVVWIPFAGYNSTVYGDLLSTAYRHYVVPLYQPYEGDFYYGLSKNNGKLDGLIADAAISTSDSIVKTLWSKLCGQH